MAKDKLTDYDSTAANNLDVGGISVAEGMLPSGVNNAIRELMSHQADAFGAGTPLYVDQTNNRLGVGTTSPDNPLHVVGDSTFEHRTNVEFKIQDATDTGGGTRLSSYWKASGSDVEIGNVEIDLSDGTTGSEDANIIFKTIGAGTLAEAMRIDSSGNVLVGKSISSTAVQGIEVDGSNGLLVVTRNGYPTATFNRLTSDGAIIDLRKDSTTVGSIGVDNSDNLVIEGNSGHSGIQFGTNALLPHKNGAVADNLIDLGSPTERYDDVYATNGTIQTSDANEKQQIAALTDAEITAAKAISQLFKTFKWNSAVEAKGDAARTHAGVIAQDVQAAMTAAGLDAGDYAFFISSTWWETQTEVPAVEAVDAVLDEDGNVVTEAVEAVAAYTRTDTYDTAEEAPEGAVERTRLGIRYPELLAFVGAATEQRLGNIETRLAALEAN